MTCVKNSSKFICTFIFILLLLLSTTACSYDETREWIENTFGIIVSGTETTVKTPAGSSVTAYKWVSGEYSTDNKNEIRDAILEEYPNVTIISPASTKYNCHSYAWYSQSTSNAYFIPNPSKYYTDGSYSLITSSTSPLVPSTVPSGSKVRYVGDDHSAIVYSTSKLTSKWGPGCVVRHAPMEGPYDGVTSFKYYERAY